MTQFAAADRFTGAGEQTNCRVKPAAVRPIRIGLFLLAIVTLTGCELGYYWQAAGGQLEILRKRRPIEEVLADEGVDQAVKAKLRLVLAVQEFGVERLSLPAEGKYLLYADLGRPNVSWLVVASEEFAIKAVEHCFLIVGCLGYRGYFDKADANALAEELAAENFDVRVRPVRAYSTLGWFDDPVLNTFLQSVDELGVIGTIIHEQAHRLLFVKGDTTFNESFAHFVEAQGTGLFLAERGDDGAAPLERYRAQGTDRDRFRTIVKRGAERLNRLYRSELTAEEMRVEKIQLFDRMRRDYQNEKNSFIIDNYDGWFDQPLNNAHLVSFTFYESRVAAFRALFVENEEDFSRFFAAVRTLAELPQEERRARLDMLEIQDAANTRHSTPATPAPMAQG